MSDALWVVRAGEKAKFISEFEAGSYIAIAFHELATDDLRPLDEPVLRARARTPAERTYAGQLVTFAYKIDMGDLVIVPRLASKHRDYLVARVVGPYQYVSPAPQSGNHRRAVEWLGRFSREAISPAAANTLGAIQTVFRATAVEPELRALLTALAPMDTHGLNRPNSSTAVVATDAAPSPSADSTLPVRVEPTIRPLVPAQLDITLDGQGRARISSAHPALAMEQAPRHVAPSSDWGGVPGIYVLTGTHLDHSSSWTGNERTLTTALIVRPWAYVGLSEDFLGRIGSHRQSKPEWRRALLVRSGGQPFSSDDIKHLERQVHAVLLETGEVNLPQSVPRGNLSAKPKNPAMLDACADTVVAVLRLTGTLI